MPNSKEYRARFNNGEVIDENFIIASYTRFIETIREKYPAANIICMLGNMSITKENTPWPGYVQRAVDSMNDSKIFTFFIPYKNSNGHPKVDEQREMADRLIRFIDRNILW